MKIGAFVVSGLLVVVPAAAVHRSDVRWRQPHETRIVLEAPDQAYKPTWWPNAEDPAQPGYLAAHGTELDPREYPSGTTFALHLATGSGHGWGACWRLYDATLRQPVPGSQACHVNQATIGLLGWFVDDLPIQLPRGCHLYYLQRELTARYPSTDTPRVLAASLTIRWRE